MGQRVDIQGHMALQGLFKEIEIVEEDSGVKGVGGLKYDNKSI